MEAVECKPLSSSVSLWVIRLSDSRSTLSARWSQEIIHSFQLIPEKHQEEKGLIEAASEKSWQHIMNLSKQNLETERLILFNRINNLWCNIITLPIKLLYMHLILASKEKLNSQKRNRLWTHTKLLCIAIAAVVSCIWNEFFQLTLSANLRSSCGAHKGQHVKELKCITNRHVALDSRIC